ncbi:MAG TPA: hypothetical protein VLA04_01595, partial [Verrucomicrobiae bacterium]|nr:hypothetical protein [Verrucomicrobiae bacterium]
MTHHFQKVHEAAIAHHKHAVRHFHKGHKHARKLLKQHKVVIHKVREHSVKTAALTTISAGMLATPALLASPQQAGAHGVGSDPGSALEATTRFAQNDPFEKVSAYGPSIADANKQAIFKDRIARVASGTGHEMGMEEEAAVAQVIQETFGITARAELSGVRLNHQRGIIAGEQHLPLYPGDTINNHFKNPITGQVADPTANLTGMVPGLPSWGYFAKSKAEVTKEQYTIEQFGMVVQTFKSRGWEQNTSMQYKFYKYRKMIMINHTTGKAVVGAVVDAGP